MVNLVRTLIFYFVLVIFTVIYASISLLTVVLPLKQRYCFITFYSKVVIYLVKVICGVHYMVIGKENLPEKACVVISNHQSTWETLAFQRIFPMQTWVVKKQLLKIPFFGWAFALLKPIAIDRRKKTAAMEQILEKGKQQLAEGRWLIVFPEGTRIAPNTYKKFSKGGAIIAKKTHTAIVPVAHNAGMFWGKHSFSIKPGKITVIIGEPITVADKNVEEINEASQTWIWDQLKRIIKEINK